MNASRNEDIQIISQDSERYPILLNEISSPPRQLFVRGDVKSLTALKPIAVVGTRKMTDYGRRVLHTIIPALVEAGATIVSGLAYGIDSLAHEIALEHGGQCIAVLANGLDSIYPTHHHGLAQRIILCGGAIVSEQPLGTKPLRQYFPARNRIISGLSQATIIVEAKEKSGSLITGKFALEQNRDVFAVPGSIFDDSQRGANRLISQGAYPVISVEDLLAQLQLASDRKKPAARKLTFESDEEKLIYETLKEPQTLNDISTSTSLSAALIAQLMSLMELKGTVRNLGGMRFGRA